MFNLSPYKKQVLDTMGNLLIMGGPGSGKTTIALLKAKRIIESGNLAQGQSVLFLSFARATISRVEQQANIVIPKTVAKQLEINTYHSFAWNILRSHGYLLCSKDIRMLLPYEASAKLAGFVDDVRKEEIIKLYKEEGLVHFDLFASLCAELLSRSDSLATIISDSYPIIILDEFQDTNEDEWELISQLGKRSILIVLADPEQRIYDFRGADPARIGQFIEKFDPSIFDFESENNRSQGTDIVQFGNDLLSGKNKDKAYNNVECHYYKTLKGNAHILETKIAVIKAIQRLKQSTKQDWSIAVLVPANSIMLAVSDCLDTAHRLRNGKLLPPIYHEVVVESAGPSLAAIIIARLLELGSLNQGSVNQLIVDLCEYIRGRHGSIRQPSKSDLSLSKALIEYTQTSKIGGPKRKVIIDECVKIVNQCNNLEFTGEITSDWIKVRELLSEASSECLNNVKKDAAYLRLLHKGSILNSSLSEIWRRNDNYRGATEAVKNALIQEHFATSTKTWTGVNVMTIHKAKGKEFDEVIIYEGAFPGQRIVHNEKTIDQARLNLRVAVTRAKSKVTILTPKKDSCCLL
jgi:DNA helicase-2/ATP-dependent DNA helicase PcrA